VRGRTTHPSAFNPQANPGKPILLSYTVNENYCKNALMLLVRPKYVVIFVDRFWTKNRFPRVKALAPHPATPHPPTPTPGGTLSGAPKPPQVINVGKSVTLSVGTFLCPYGIIYRRTYGLSTSGLFKKPQPQSNLGT
jgi:hypothetical protein